MRLKFKQANLSFKAKLRTDSNLCTGSLSKWGFVSRTCAILCVHPKHQGAIEPLVTSWYHPMRKQGDWQAPFHFFGTHEFTSQFTVFEAIQFYKSLGGLV